MTHQPRLAVVGVGYLGSLHAKVLAQMPQCNVVFIADRDEGRAQAISSELDIPDWGSLESVPPDLDGAVVAVDTAQHLCVALTLLEKGTKTLMVEKPLAPTASDAKKIARACDEASVPLLVGHLERFNPVVEALDSHLTIPRFAEIHRLGAFVPRSLDQDVLVDLMIHDLELLLHWVKHPVEEVHAVGIPVVTPNVDIANVRLRFFGGCVANVTASRVSREKVRKVRIFQENAYFSLDLQNQTIEAFEKIPGKTGMEAIAPISFSVPEGQPLQRELAHLMAIISEKATPRVTGKQAIAALEVAEAVKLKIG